MQLGRFIHLIVLQKRYAGIVKFLNFWLVSQLGMLKKSSKFEKSAKKTKYHTVVGSSRIRIMVVKPNDEAIKVAPYLCVCEKCEVEIGSCDLYYEPNFSTTENRARKPTTRADMNADSDSSNESGSDDDESGSDDDDDETETAEWYADDTVCALAPDSNDDTRHSLYFVFIKGSGMSEDDQQDAYGHQATKGQDFIWGHYLEEEKTLSKGVVYKFDETKKVFFFKESIVYPFVNVEEKYDRNGKMNFFLKTDYCEALIFVEETKMSLLL